ncbi:type 1 glutamine amidotransferase domain-containing protein [Dokdonella sp.]|uniref:type 1 glutamine amidotransferase domain-containing protein n=1 Tax=Dokdonella sp. TaxID=2291710 RepID=UPI001B016057|nr:type 1 glutamine amidotransferase domain-containing protein [Dokdonella sp.]MBO9664104.1 type 1 glutamine amidotransferase [Dokdonella sp.]
MAGKLNGKTVAILATNGFEQSELEVPKQALEGAGAAVDVIAPNPGEIQGFMHFDKGTAVEVDCTLDEVSAKDYDALVLPGGVFNPDALRTDEKAVRFVRDFFDEHKPVGAICHGGWTLIDAGVVEGRRMTSVRSIRTDLRNAGATVLDEEVVVDEGLVTSRTPHDLPAFCRTLVEEIAEGRHAGQHAVTRRAGSKKPAQAHAP